MKKADKIKRVFGKILKLIARLFMLLWCAFGIFAIYWVVMTSLKTNRELFTSPWGLPGNPSFENYVKVWGNYNLGGYFLNSILVVLPSVLCILLVSTPAAYVLSRIPFKGRKPISFAFVAGMGIPYQLILIPLYMLIYKLDLVDSLIGLVIVYTALSIPFTIFLLMSFFKTLPTALEDAARIDGCGSFQTFFYVMLPLGRPGVITASIFNFISLWNEFLLTLVFLKDSSLYTLSVGLNALQSSMQYSGDWTALFAGMVLVLIPTLLVYLLLSRRIIEGLTMGAVKE